MSLSENKHNSKVTLALKCGTIMCCFTSFYHFLVTFGGFKGFGKNEEIQDGGSKMASSQS